MSGTDAFAPVRSCLGCRQRRPQPDLVRFTKSAAGIIVDGRSDGRGAWLCRSRREDALVVPHCLDTALAKGQFARAWRGPLSADDERTIRELAGMVAGGDTLADGH